MTNYDLYELAHKHFYEFRFCGQEGKGVPAGTYFYMIEPRPIDDKNMINFRCELHGCIWSEWLRIGEYDPKTKSVIRFPHDVLHMFAKNLGIKMAEILYQANAKSYEKH